MENSRNPRGPRPCNLKKIAWPMLACLFSALSASPSLVGCGKSGGPLAIVSMPEGGFSLDYGRRELPGSDMAAPRVSGLLPVSPLYDALPQLVKIQSAEGILGIPITRSCLLSQAPFFFEREKGLRLAYCPPGESEERIRDLLRAARERREHPSPPETRLEIHEDGFAMGIAALPRLREIVAAGGPVLVSVDGGLPGGRPLHGDFRGSSRHFTAGPRSPDGINGDSPPVLGRVFPGTAFHLLVRNERIFLIYELNSREFLFVSLEPDALPAEEIGNTLEAIQNELNSAARNTSPLLTEIYFGDQGPRSAAYVELGTPGDENIRAKLRLRGHANLELELFLFSGGTVLLPGTIPGPRDELIMEGDDGTRRAFRLEDYRARGAGPGRSLTPSEGDLRNNSTELRPARFTRGREIAGNPGLHPRFARPEYLSTMETICGVADFRLTEWNPFGLREADGRVLTGGKFLELRLERTCRNESILVFAGDVVLDPGSRLFKQGEILLFVADGAYFERRDVLENSKLRGLRSDARIRIRDVKIAPGEYPVLREPIPSAIYIYGALDSPYLARVHSLIPASPGMGMFHGAGVRGLRGDLAPHHAMSPGFAHPAEKPSIESGRLRFSEILPRGSRDASGKSIAGDEFLELRVAPHGDRRAGAYGLRITPVSGVERLYVFPSPRTEDGFAHLVFARNDSTCFDYGEGLVPVSALSLPNGAAQYTLRDARGGLLDELHMDNALQGRLDDSLRVSYTRAFDHIWRPSQGPAAESPRCPLTRATPGRESSFAAFVVSLPGPEPRFRYHGLTSARLRIRGGNRPDAFRDLGEVRVAPGDVFYAPPMTNYHLFEIADAGDGSPFFSGQYYGTTPSLIIAGVSPRPTAGRFEWIRLCSPGGFTGDSPTGSLFIRDGHSADRIIPWNQRRPAAMLPPGLAGDALRLNPGECALLIDPDFAGGDLLIDNRDSALWTIASGSALGNGLASGESLRLYYDSPGGDINLASMGLPGTALPWSMSVNTGEYLRRLPGSERDARENFEIAIIE